jgi:hypothetical protein
MVTGQELDDQSIRVWSLAEARDLSLLIALNSSWDKGYYKITPTNPNFFGYC